MPSVQLWASLPSELHPLFYQSLNWLQARSIRVFDEKHWHALLPYSLEAPFQVHWLWERLRGQLRDVAIYASWGIQPQTFPFAPFPFNLQLDAGIFGSGKHPTTQMCLIALQSLQLQGRWLLDIGTGSGILAAVGLAQGAKVVATEISSRAARQAFKNLNSIKKADWAVVVCDLTSCLRKTFDVVVCNISAEALMRLLPDLSRIMPEGFLVASGWMASEWRSLYRALRSFGLRLTSWQFLNGWMGIVAAC
jgi:ribosomal protein L11 methyltransferase